MNKAELINAISEKSGLSKNDSKKALDAFISSVIESLETEEKVSLIGFGTFSVGVRQERTGINPSTKQAITIPEKKVVKFKAGLDLSNAVN